MKKFLSLALALVMCLSLVTISAGATEFKDLTDVDEIEHAEAVELFNKIGIIAGYEDGSFGPEKTITREQAAKIIATMALGNDAATKLGAESAPFKDVPVTSQFAGYIGYCVSAGIIDGYKDGTFKPKGTLTGYQFAKMLLGVLGYGVKDEYVGTNWALNVARDGASIGLFDDATVTVGLIDRDNATQIAFNALTSSLVTYSELLGTYTAYNMMTQTLLGTLASNIFGLTTTGKVDGYGYNVHAWRQSGKVITEYYNSDKVLGTEKKAISYGNIYKNYSWDDSVELYINGTQYYVDNTGNLTKTAPTNNNNISNMTPSAFLKNVITKTMNGWTVNLVDVDEARVNAQGQTIGWAKDGDVEKIIVTIPYLAQVTSVKAATSSADRSVTLKVYAAKSGSTSAFTVTGVETEDFAKDDYILVTPSSNDSNGFKEPLDMVAAESVEGKVTAYYTNSATNNNGSITVDGAKYNYNFIFADANNIALGDDLAQSNYLLNKATYTFFLDDCGNVIGVKVKDDAVSDYAYIISVGEDSFKQNNVVKVLLSDGSIGTYTVSSKSSVSAYHGNSASEEATDYFAAPGQIYAYSINAAGEIVLDTVSSINSSYAQVLYSKANSYSANNVGATTTAGTITKFTKGYAVITMSNGQVVYADDSTVFVYRDGNTVTTFVGKSNAPSIESAKNASVVRKTSNGTPYATYIVVEGKPANSMTDNYVYVLSNNPYGNTQDVDGNTVYLYKVIKDGAKVNIAVDSRNITEGVYQYGIKEDKYTGDSANEVEAGLYALTAANRGVVGGGTNGDYKANVVIGVSSNDNVIVVPNNNDQFVISPDTKITDISDQSDIQTEASFEVGDTVTVVYKVTSGLQIADAVYITSHTGVKTIDVSNVTSTTTTQASDIKVLGDGVYKLDTMPTSGDLSGQISGAITDNMFFKFTSVVAGNVTLTIDSTTVYTETANLAAGAHFFYIQVTGTPLHNMGTGTLATTALTSGVHTYTIVDANNNVLMSGTFTI